MEKVRERSDGILGKEKGRRRKKEVKEEGEKEGARNEKATKKRQKEWGRGDRN